MAEKTKDVQPPRGISRILWRIPILLFRIGLGGLMGKRFLLLHHKGRKSGIIRQAVVEIVQFEQETGCYYVVSGFGPKSDWYQNVVAHPDVTIQIGSKKIAVQAIQVPAQQAEIVLLDYTRRYPGALKILSGILGYQIIESEADIRFMATVIPMIRFEPI
jgi:deazaflavin-dependent oxidoreductase (nitroreductase family)